MVLLGSPGIRILSANLSLEEKEPSLQEDLSLVENLSLEEDLSVGGTCRSRKKLHIPLSQFGFDEYEAET